MGRRSNAAAVLGLSVVVVAGAGIYLYGRFGTSEPPGKIDFRDVRGYMSRLGRSDSREAKRIRAELANASMDLARERASAQADEIPVFPQQLITPPIPAPENAAPLYQQLQPLLQKVRKGLPQGQYSMVEQPMGPRYAYSAEDLARGRKELARYAGVLATIRQATDRPKCDFHRNWNLGAAVLFPEYAQMRGAARLLTSESFLLAKEGRFGEAVRDQSRGFTLAQHAAADPTLIGYLVGVAIDAITLRALENLMDMAGPNAEVDDLVRRTIERNRPRFSLRHALDGELGMVSVDMAQIRAGGPQAITNFVAMDGSSSGPTPSASAKWSPEEERFISESLDAAEARVVGHMHQLILVADAPLPDRISRLNALKLPDNPTDPAGILGGVFMFASDQLGTNGARIVAQENVDIAAASVMAYKARHGSWPSTLDQALKSVPMDPFTGRPLKYRREPNGFVVYSVGSDGKFTGGKPGMKREPRQNYYRYPPAPAIPPPAEALGKPRQ